MDPFPHFVGIQYPNDDDAISIEEISEDGRAPARYNINKINKKSSVSPPEIIYSASIKVFGAEKEFSPSDRNTKHVFPLGICWGLRRWLCKIHNVERISIKKNPSFEEFFEGIIDADGQMQGPSNISYLQNIPASMIPSPILCIMTEAALVSENAESFKELIHEIDTTMHYINIHINRTYGS